MYIYNIQSLAAGSSSFMVQRSSEFSISLNLPFLGGRGKCKYYLNFKGTVVGDFRTRQFHYFLPMSR